MPKIKQMKQIPFTVSAVDAQVTVPFGKGKDVQNMVYKRSSVASIAVEDDCVCMMGNWTLQNPSVANPRQQKLRGYSVS